MEFKPDLLKEAANLAACTGNQNDPAVVALRWAYEQLYAYQRGSEYAAEEYRALQERLAAAESELAQIKTVRERS